MMMGTTIEPQNRRLIRALNTCIETCMDGEKGFAIAAAEVRDPMLKETLLSRSKQRAEFMVQLQKAVARLGGFPENEGTARGGLHRGWMTMRRVVEGRNDATYLEECIRGEQAALRDYEAAIRRARLETFPADLSTLVMEQHRAVRESLAEIIQITAKHRTPKQEYYVQLVDLPPQALLTRRTKTTLAQLPALMHATLEAIARGVHEVGVPLAIYHNEPFRPENIDVEVGVLVPPDVVFANADGIVRRELPAGPVAFTLHIGPYEQIGAAYEALFAWIREHHKAPAGPAREIYLVGPGDTTSAENYRTEVEIPIL